MTGIKVRFGYCFVLLFPSSPNLVRFYYIPSTSPWQCSVIVLHLSQCSCGVFFNKGKNCKYFSIFLLTESQSNHSNQSDSGVSDTQTGHVRSQSIVSSIFSEAWKRGTQLEESSKINVSTITVARECPLYKSGLV